MKKAFWISTCCTLSVLAVFSQDDNYYNNNNSNSGDNKYNNGSQSIPPAGYNAQTNQSIPPASYNDYSNYNNQPANQAPGSGNYTDNNTTANNYNNPPANQAPADNNNYYANNNNTYNAQPDNQYANNNASNDNLTYQSAHDQLSPYGNWISYPGYGNVWVPRQVPADFSPYATAGHWVYTTYGWSWVSDYAWGGIPFHYGRWFRDNAYGWMWVPGYQWAAAWVTWGNYDNYYCWAPLAPFAGFSAYYRPNPFYWNFCDRAHFCDFHLGLYRGFYGRGDYRGIAARINVIGESRMYGGHAYFAGPRVGEVEHAVGHSISAANLYHGNQGMVARNNSQYRAQGNINQYHNQNFANHQNVHTNHFAGNNVQRAQQYNHSNYNIARANNRGQNQRSNYNGQNQMQQHNQYSSPSRGAQSYRMPQRGAERTFASAQRSSSHGSARSGGGSHGGRR